MAASAQEFVKKLCNMRSKVKTFFVVVHLAVRMRENKRKRMLLAGLNVMPQGIGCTLINEYILCTYSADRQRLFGEYEHHAGHYACSEATSRAAIIDSARGTFMPATIEALSWPE